MKTKCIVSALTIAIVIFTLDQWSKMLILAEPDLVNNHVIEITSFFNLALVYNRGVSFGMFASYNQPLLLTLLSLVIISILLVWLYRNKSMTVACAIGMVIGGAGGNIIDRQRYGAVVDFLDFHIGDLHWPAFNVADSSVFIGVVVLCIYSMFFEEKNHTKESI